METDRGSGDGSVVVRKKENGGKSVKFTRLEELSVS